MQRHKVAEFIEVKNVQVGLVGGFCLKLRVLYQVIPTVVLDKFRDQFGDVLNTRGLAFDRSRKFWREVDSHFFSRFGKSFS